MKDFVYGLTYGFVIDLLNDFERTLVNGLVTGLE